MRKPASVIGDGTHTIAELIEQINQDPERGEAVDGGKNAVYTKKRMKIKVDQEVEQTIAKKYSMNLTSIPAA